MERIDDNEIPKEIYLVELVYMSAEMYNVYEVSVSIGYADWDEEIEQWDNFERNDYVSERYFLSDSKKGFIFGNEIENIDWDEIDVSKLYIDEYYEDEEEANKYAEKLILVFLRPQCFFYKILGKLTVLIELFRFKLL